VGLSSSRSQHRDPAKVDRGLPQPAAGYPSLAASSSAVWAGVACFCAGRMARTVGGGVGRSDPTLPPRNEDPCWRFGLQRARLRRGEPKRETRALVSPKDKLLPPQPQQKDGKTLGQRNWWLSGCNTISLGTAPAGAVRAKQMASAAVAGLSILSRCTFRLMGSQKGESMPPK